MPVSSTDRRTRARPPLVARGESLDRDHDVPGLGELDGVADEIEQDLPDPARVADQVPRRSRQAADDELDTLGRGLTRQQASHVLGQKLQIEGAWVELHHARFDLGEVEDVVDHGQQRATRSTDRLDVVALLFVERRPRERIGHPHHAVHGRAELVAHVGEEAALGRRGLLGPGLRCTQLGLVLLVLRHVADRRRVHRLRRDRAPPHREFAGEVLALGRARDQVHGACKQRGGRTFDGSARALPETVELEPRQQFANVELVQEPPLEVEESRGCRVDRLDRAIVVEGHDPVGRGLEDHARARRDLA